jgi:lipoprotein-anchoring transpeptidase ErfK/SrfK
MGREKDRDRHARMAGLAATGGNAGAATRPAAGGIDNPLGARALYLGSSLYRINGSNEPWTLGTNVSSGCIRMRNEDVTDLYQRVKVGTKVVVI